jgi:enoyl-CoA hydratase/carnithine racemase
VQLVGFRFSNKLMRIEPEPPSPSPALLQERRDGVVLLTLNRPAKLNALNRALQSELSRALDALAADATVRVLILTGAGRGFCAGLDLGDFSNSLSHFQTGSDASVFDKLDALTLPVIAAINGPAVTGGLELALACDVRMASRAATFADTHALLGVPPGAGLSQKLPRAIGQSRAMAMSLSGDFLPAEAAYAAGLVSHLCEPAALLPEAWALAGRIAAADPAMVREVKRLIKEGARLPLGDALRMERSAHDRWAEHADLGPVLARREGVLKRERGQLGRN